MGTWRPSLIGPILCSLVMLLAGCGRAQLAASNDLKEIGLMYHQYFEKNAKPPAKIDDLEPFARDFRKGFQGCLGPQRDAKEFQEAPKAK